MGCSRGRSRWLRASDVQTQGGAYSAEREAENKPTGSRESGDLLPVQSGPLPKPQHNYRGSRILVPPNTHLSLWTHAVVTFNVFVWIQECTQNLTNADTQSYMSNLFLYLNRF